MATSLVVGAGTATAMVPAITGVTTMPAAPGAADAVVVTATITDPDAPVLTYKVAFGADVEVAMTDDGVAPDATAADGVFSASIPAQAAGELVRYNVADGAVSVPTAADSVDYEGYVVTDPSVTTTISDFRWFIEPTDFDALFASRLLEDPNVVFDAVIAFDGEVYDGVEVGISGNSFARENYPKQSFEFSMPTGHFLETPDIPYALKSFELKGSWVDFVFGRNDTALQVFEEAGFPAVNTVPVHVERNGEFYGMFVISEILDGRWLNRRGLTDGEFFEASFGGWLFPGEWNVVRGTAGNTDSIDAVSTVLRQPASSEKTQFLYDTFDIPQLINYMAVSAVVGHNDQKTDNFWVYNDSSRTGRWQVYPWDLEVSFGVDLGGCDNQDIPDLSCIGNLLFDSVYEVAELDEMYWRRVRSVLDGPFASPGVENGHATRIAALGAEPAAEEAVWDRFNATLLVPQFQGDIAGRRSVFNAEPRVPTAQPSNPAVVISEILPAPVTGQAEYVELYNPNGIAVDVSEWTIDAVDATIPHGTVIPSGGYLVLTSDVASFDAGQDPYKTTVVQFGEGLKNSGESLVLKNASGATIDTVTYAQTAPWPTVTGGRSYVLTDLASNNNNGANWAVSDTVGGTPGPTRSAPDAPGGVTAVALENNQSTVSWNPADDGGADVTGYTVTASPGGATCQTTTATSCAVTGLTGATRYTFSVTATNELGTSSASAEVTVVVGPLAETFAPGDPCYGLIPTHVGTNGADEIYATQGDDIIFAFGGDDTVWGRDGADIICAGSGADRVFAGSGDNIVYGEAGIDKMRAGVDSDTIYGGDSRDFIKGGHGDDIIYGEGGSDRIRGSVGNDVIRGGGDNDVMWGGPGNDSLRGNDGDDILKGSAGTDTCNGGPGTDIADVSCETISFVP